MQKTDMKWTALLISPVIGNILLESAACSELFKREYKMLEQMSEKTILIKLRARWGLYSLATHFIQFIATFHSFDLLK